MAATLSRLVEPVDQVEEMAFRVWRELHPKQWASIKAMQSHPNAQVLMGGSGGGGKSYGLRAGAVWWAMWLVKEGLSTDKFRRKILFSTLDYPALQDRHLDKFIREYGDLGKVVSTKDYGLCFMWNAAAMPPICFRNLDKTRSRKGSEFCGGFLDEVTELTKGQYGDFMYMARDPGVPFNPVLMGTNPDGIGHFWVKSMWRPLQAQTVIPLEDQDTDEPLAFHAEGKLSEEVDPLQSLDPKSLVYVPFLPDDNPTFDEALFMRNIAGLAPHVQRARRYGTWDSPEGARWVLASPDVQGFDPNEMWHSGVPQHYRKMLSMDYGTRAPYCALWAAVDCDGNVWVWQEDYKPNLTAWRMVKRIKERTPVDHVIQHFNGDPAMWDKVPNHTDNPENDFVPASVIIDGIADDDRFKCGFTHGTGARRVLKWATFDKFLERGNGYADLWIANNCTNLWNELLNAVYPKGTIIKDASEDIDESCPDHALTALAYMIHTHFGSAKQLKVKSEAEKIEEQRIQRFERQKAALARKIRKQT